MFITGRVSWQAVDGEADLCETVLTALASNAARSTGLTIDFELASGEHHKNETQSA